MEDDIICPECKGLKKIKQLVCNNLVFDCDTWLPTCGKKCPGYLPQLSVVPIPCMKCNGNGIISWIDKLFLNG